MAHKNKVKGNTYERYLGRVFRAIGFSFAKTSRLASQLYDDSGFDLWGIPYLLQAKSGYVKSRIKPDTEFKNMAENLTLNFPPGSPEHKFIKVVFNKLDGYKVQNHLVTFQFKDIIRILAKFHKYEELLSEAQLKAIDEEITIAIDEA
jgi:hypothetical protein